MTASWFAAAIIAVILGVLLIASRVLAKLGAFLLVAGLVVVAALVAVASAQQARATQAVATAAAIASGGQTLALVAIVVLVVALLLALAAASYLYLRLRRTEARAAPQRPSPGAWAPGPYAYWRRVEPSPDNGQAQALQQQLMLELLRELQELREQQSPALLPQDSRGQNVALFDDEWWR